MIVGFYAPDRGFAAWRAAFATGRAGVEVRFDPDLGDRRLIEAVVVWRPDPVWLSGFPALRAVHSLGAGVDHLPMAVLRDRGIPVLRLIDPGLTATMVDYCLGQVLRLHLNDPAYRRQQAREEWQAVPGMVAGDRRVSILGLGELGVACALRFAAHGFTVAGWSRSARAVPGVATYHGADGLHTMLGVTDILLCLLPLTDATRGIMNAALFAQLPKGAMVINAGRGGHVNEDDLLQALGCGHIAEAILDVTAIEPLPPGHPFWTHPQVALTPHVAAITDPATAADIILDTLRRTLAGETTSALVDPDRGY